MVTVNPNIDEESAVAWCLKRKLQLSFDTHAIAEFDGRITKERQPFAIPFKHPKINVVVSLDERIFPDGAKERSIGQKRADVQGVTKANDIPKHLRAVDLKVKRG